MLVARLIARYALRRPLRLALTLLGTAAAIACYGLLIAIVDAWDRREATPAASRVVTYSAASMSNTLPLAHRDRIGRVEGVLAVTHVYWFNGSYGDGREFFPKFAVDAASYLDVYPELRLAAAERAAFVGDRAGCLVGARLAARHRLAVGDPVTLTGGRIPGPWRFTVRGIFASDHPQQEWQLLFHWSLLDETLRQHTPWQGQRVGAYVSRTADARDTATIARAIDALFASAHDSTWSEPENSFLLGFLLSAEAAFAVVRALSLLVVATVLIVLSTTMLQSGRERYRDYATLKAIGFGPLHVALLLVGEATLIALAGGALGAGATGLLVDAFERLSGGLVPVLAPDVATTLRQLGLSAAIGVAGAAIPCWLVARRPVATSLRTLG